MSPLRHMLAWVLLSLAAAILAPVLQSPDTARRSIERWQAQLDARLGHVASRQIMDSAVATRAEAAHRLLAMRALTLTAWLPVLLPLWLAALLQGWAWRSGRQQAFAPANPRLYLAALHLSIALAGGGLLALLSPLELPVAAVPVWGAVLSLCLGCALLHRPAWRV